MTANKTILSTDTNKNHAGCHCAQIAAASASPCLARDLNARTAALAATAAAAHANDAVIAWRWLVLKLGCESSLAQAACSILLRNATMHVLAVVVIAEAA